MAMNEGTISRGRSIRMFLADGTATSLIIAEIVNWTGKAILVPRAELANFLKRREAQNAGVYILSGPDPDDPFRVSVYVGESETVGQRLRTHGADESMDFFEKAIVFVSKDENLTKAHAKHLEAHLSNRIKSAGRVTPMNGNTPGGAALPEADVADMEYFLDQIELMLPVLGLDVLRPLTPTPKEASDPTIAKPTATVADAIKALAVYEYEFRVGQAVADAIEFNGEFVVQAGSIGRDIETPTMQKTYRALREQLKADGAIQAIDNQALRFTRSVPFSSPSAAACVLYGASISGPKNWYVKGTQTSYAEQRDAALLAAERAAAT